MKQLFLYWAVKKGHPLWDEELIMESEERLDIKEFKKLMAKRGYNRVRESVYKPGDLKRQYLNKGGVII